MIGKYDFTGNRCDGKCEHNKCEQLAVQLVHHFFFSFFSFPSIELHSLPPSIHLSANENCLHDDRASTSFHVSSDSRQTRLALNSRLKEVSIRFSKRKQFNARRKTWNVNFCCFIKRFIEERGRREKKKVSNSIVRSLLAFFPSRVACHATLQGCSKLVAGDKSTSSQRLLPPRSIAKLFAR